MAAGEDQAQPVVGHLVVGAVAPRAPRPRRSRPRPPPASSPRPAGSRRTRSRARLRATVVSQAPGRRGTPSRGQRSSATAKASCAHSSARSQSPVSRTRVATTRPHSAWNASATAASTSARHISQIGLTSMLPVGHRGSSPPPRWPRRGPCSRRRSSRRAAPWSRRRDRRSPAPRRCAPRTVVASLVGRSRSPPCSTPRSAISFIRTRRTRRHGVVLASGGVLGASSRAIISRYRMMSSLVFGVWFVPTTIGTRPGSTPRAEISRIVVMARSVARTYAPSRGDPARTTACSSWTSGPIAGGGGCVARAPDGRGRLRPARPPGRAGAGPGHRHHLLVPAGRRGRDPDASPDRVAPPCPHAGPGTLWRLRLPARERSRPSAGSRRSGSPSSSRLAGVERRRGRAGRGRQRRARLAHPGARRGGPRRDRRVPAAPLPPARARRRVPGGQPRR